MLIQDQTLAEGSDNTQGVELFAGPRVGPQAVETIECEGRTEPITITDGQVTETGPVQRQVPKRIRRAVLARDRQCVIDSCQNTYRLQTHHIIPRHDGGPRHGRQPRHPLLVPPPHRHPPAWTPHRPPHTTTPPPPTPDPHLAPLPAPTNLEYLSPHQQQQRAYQAFLDKYHPQQPHPGGWWGLRYSTLVGCR